MLIDLASAVQLVGGDAVKQALCLPRHPGDAVHGPPHLNLLLVVGGLPHALHLHVQLAEEQLSVEAERPEDDAVVLQALELVARVAEDDVLAVNVICNCSIHDKCVELCRRKGVWPVTEGERELHKSRNNPLTENSLDETVPANHMYSQFRSWLNRSGMSSRRVRMQSPKLA